MEERLNYKRNNFEFWNGKRNVFQPALKIFAEARNDGFTTVILTYDRFDSLLKVIKK